MFHVDVQQIGIQACQAGVDRSPVGSVVSGKKNSATTSTGEESETQPTRAGAIVITSPAKERVDPRNALYQIA